MKCPPLSLMAIVLMCSPASAAGSAYAMLSFLSLFGRVGMPLDTNVWLL